MPSPRKNTEQLFDEPTGPLIRWGCNLLRELTRRHKCHVALNHAARQFVAIPHFEIDPDPRLGPLFDQYVAILVMHNVSIGVNYCCFIARTAASVDTMILDRIERGTTVHRLGTYVRLKQGRWPELEQLLLKGHSPVAASEYITVMIRDRWPEYEEFILRDRWPDSASAYMKAMRDIGIGAWRFDSKLSTIADLSRQQVDG